MANILQISEKQKKIVLKNAAAYRVISQSVYASVCLYVFFLCVLYLYNLWPVP